MTDWAHHLDFERIHNVLMSLPQGQRSAYIEQLAATVGRSPSTIYREHARRYGRSKTIERQPAAVTEEDVRRVCLVKETYQGLLPLGQSRELSTEAALEILADEGYKRARSLCPSTVNAALRRAGYRQVAPRVRVEAGRACQQYQIDFSRSKHFQIIAPTEDGDWLVQVSAKELHYKDPLSGARLRTWVVQIIDEYSRLRILRYYAATGEDRYIGLAAMSFLFNRADDSHLMRHIPERLKSDQGAFLKSQEGRSVCEALGIRPVFTRPGNKESQGKVERGFRTTWQTFEARLATQITFQQGPKARLLLSEVARLAHEYTIGEHALRHPVRTDERRGAMYQQSVLRHRPQEVDADLRELALRTWERRADATGLIRIDRVPFEVPAFAFGKWVRVYRTLTGEFAGTLIDGYRDRPFHLRPFRFRDLDDFAGREHTTFQQEMAMAAKARQEELAAQATPIKPRADKAQPTTPVMEARAHAGPERLSRLEAMAAVGEVLRQWGIDPAELPIARYVPGPMTRTDLSAVIDLITQSAQRKAI